ncbi:MAG: DUF2306 domain-containing protein [Oceanicaulis sp.]
MSAVTTAGQSPVSQRLLSGSAAAWFTVAVAGQAVFAAYIAAFYGATLMGGDWRVWAERMINGIVEGDRTGNIIVISHIVLAFAITVGGPLQFIPAIRNGFPRFHRLNGRIYLSVAVLISLGAFYLVWVRDHISVINGVAISGNGVLILYFAVQTVRHAMVRRFDVHHRWALRLFIAASGVWFFRVAFGLWAFLTGFQVPGVRPDLTGAFDIFAAFGCYLIPLAILELYFRARRAPSSPGLALGASAVVLAGTAATGVGAVGAVLIFMLPAFQLLS